MSQDKETDPADVFREWVTQWERAVDSFSNQVMGTDDFSKAINTAQNTQLKFQKLFGEMMAGHLANLNMPNRQEVHQIAEGIQGLDTRMARMEAALAKLVTASGTGDTSRKGPPRTKKPAQKK